MICRGRHVTFETVGGDFLVCPRDWLLWQDVTEDFISSCTLLVAPWSLLFKGQSGSDEVQGKLLDKYYGKDVRDYETLIVDIPRKGWEPVDRVTRILYTRDGHLEGRYQHPFTSPQKLQGCDTPAAVKIDLGVCVWNERGIVSP